MHPVFTPGRPARTPEIPVVAIIPARYASTRLPGKALADIAGRPMIEHVYRRVERAACISRVIVATDDERIRRAVHAFGGVAQLTGSHHLSGTDRLAEAAALIDEDIVVNVQGDEPLIEPGAIDEAVAPLLSQPDLAMSTLCRRIDDPADLSNPHVVKVVTDRQGFALYFSRAPIPHHRAGAPHADAFKHIGLYVYRREVLLAFARLMPTPLELTEALEQLRALEHGYRIRVVETAHESVGVDTADDLDRVRAIVAQRGDGASAAELRAASRFRHAGMGPAVITHP